MEDHFFWGTVHLVTQINSKEEISKSEILSNSSYRSLLETNVLFTVRTLTSSYII